MSPGQTGHITGQMGRVPGTDGMHTRGRPAKILYVYWFFSFPSTILNLVVGTACMATITDGGFLQTICCHLAIQV